MAFLYYTTISVLVLLNLFVGSHGVKAANAADSKNTRIAGHMLALLSLANIAAILL